MIQPNLPIPLAFYYRSHFLILLFLSSPRGPPWLPSPPLSLLYPSACFAISASLYLALSPPRSLSLSLSSPTVSVFISLKLHILVFFFIIPYLSDMLQDRERLRERRALGSNAAHRDCRWHHGRKPCTCPFASDHDYLDLWRSTLFALPLIFTYSCFYFLDYEYKLI